MTCCNLAQTNPGRLAWDVADIYLSDYLEPLPHEELTETTSVVLTDDEMARVQGAYWSDSLADRFFEWTSHEEGLQLRIGGQRLDMVHTGEGRFGISAQGRAIRFEPATAPELLVTYHIEMNRGQLIVHWPPMSRA